MDRTMRKVSLLKTRKELLDAGVPEDQVDAVVPLSMFYGLGLVLVIYLLTNTMYHYVLGMEGMRESTIVARLFVLRNITSRRQAHEDKLQGEKLKAALETAGAICHQLNQPLQGISGYADLLLLKAAPESDTRAKIEGIQAEAAKMGTITSKLLNITRYRTARYTAGETIVDIERSSAKDP